ncbi:MAG: biotin--[acetyl-CoA-carboxylase] ligase [Chitinophagaceae bacterium]|nr:biotin--[acetyl-CoA-carboxylase] ligase [Chitinophagaceae bacterium]
MQNNTFSGLFVGQKIVELSKIDSTNNYLKKELSKSAPLSEGTVILADHQYAGRGQINNIWEAEAGKNLTFSILLCPSFLAPEKQFILNKAISIAINDVLSGIIGSGVKIKWPNDIYVNDSKLGGILIENVIQGKKWKYAIVGIGLNINQINFPDHLNNATSLQKIMNKEYDKRTLLTELCNAIGHWYSELRSLGYDNVRIEYFKRLYRSDGEYLFRINETDQIGKIKNVTEQGLLEIEILGNPRTFGFKEVEFVIQA